MLEPRSNESGRSPAHPERVTPQVGSKPDARSWAGGWGFSLGFPLVYWLVAELGSGLLVHPGSRIPLVWFPAGLFMSALLLAPRARWPLVVAGAMGANAFYDLSHDTTLRYIPWFLAANATQALVGALVARKLLGEEIRIERLRNFLILIGTVALGAPALGASVALFGSGRVHLLSADTSRMWWIWWATNAMAIMTVVPLVLSWRQPAPDFHRLRRNVWPWVEGMLLAGTLVSATWVILSRPEGIMVPYKARLYPLLLWAGTRFGLRGAAGANVTLAVLTAILMHLNSQAGVGGLLQVEERVLTVQTFLGVGALLCLVPAVVLRERDNTLRDLVDSEARYRVVVESSPVALAIAVDDRLVFANRTAATLMNASGPEALIGTSVYDFVLPQQHGRMRRRRARVMGQGIPAPPIDAVLRRVDGSSVMVDVRAVPIAWDGRRAILNLAQDISARKASEAALHQIATRFQAVFQSAYELMGLLSPEGILLEANATALAMVGVRRESVVGHAFWDTPWWSHSPEMQERVRRGVVVARTGAVFRTEAEHPSREGGMRMVEFSLKPVLDDRGAAEVLIAEGHDITVRVQAERELRRSQRVLSTLLVNLPGMLYRAGVGGRIDFISEGARSLTEHPPEALVHGGAVGWASLIHPEDAERVRAEIEAGIESGQPFELTYRIRTASGRERWVMERGLRISTDEGDGGGVEAFVTDITRQRHAEQERKAALAREHSAREEFTRRLIVSQEAERRRIAAGLHDSLGQNLLLVRSRAQLLLADRTLPTPMREQVRTMIETTSEALEEARQISHDLRPYQLDHLGLTGALESMLSRTAGSSGLVIERRLEPVDDLFPGDAAINLYRIVQECLNNVLKHARAHRVKVVLERDIRTVHLALEDDGVGFSPPPLGPQGARGGLGLRNMAERVSMLGGRFELVSAPGRGTRVEIVVPVNPGDTPAVTPLPGDASASFKP